jgi:hypothetical protein
LVDRLRFGGLLSIIVGIAEILTGALMFESLHGPISYNLHMVALFTFMIIAGANSAIGGYFATKKVHPVFSSIGSFLGVLAAIPFFLLSVFAVLSAMTNPHFDGTLAVIFLLLFTPLLAIALLGFHWIGDKEAAPLLRKIFIGFPESGGARVSSRLIYASGHLTKVSSIGAIIASFVILLPAMISPFPLFIFGVAIPALFGLIALYNSSNAVRIKSPSQAIRGAVYATMANGSFAGCIILMTVGTSFFLGVLLVAWNLFFLSYALLALRKAFEARRDWSEADETAPETGGGTPERTEDDELLRKVSAFKVLGGVSIISSLLIFVYYLLFFALVLYSGWGVPSYILPLLFLGSSAGLLLAGTFALAYARILETSGGKNISALKRTTFAFAVSIVLLLAVFLNPLVTPISTFHDRDLDGYADSVDVYPDDSTKHDRLYLMMAITKGVVNTSNGSMWQLTIIAISGHWGIVLHSDVCIIVQDLSGVTKHSGLVSEINGVYKNGVTFSDAAVNDGISVGDAFLLSKDIYEAGTEIVLTDPSMTYVFYQMNL